MRFLGIVVTGCLMLAAVGPTAADLRGLEALERALGEASRRYDASAATGVLSEARLLYRSEPSPAATDLHVRASLEVAELLRIEFEESRDGNREARRIIGQRIDATAEEALAILELLSPSSENARRRADLIATMIRSDFRAKKYRDNFDRAVAQALELDQENALAWVAKAKPFLFASPNHGGDLGEAVGLLTRALELSPSLESARLLRAEAYLGIGDTGAAAADWREALAGNPHCEPARRRLEEQSTSR